MIDWTTPQFLDLPDLRMAVYMAGPEDSAQPPIILCHGFPEIAYSWRAIVGPLAQAGYRVIVPDLRGFGDTGPALSDQGHAEDVALYDMPHLCHDMAHLLDAIGAETAIFAGHDWGGIFMWQLPFYTPSRIAALIGVNTPFIPRLNSDPIEAFRGALGEDFYIVAFQNFGVAESVLEADIPRALRCFYRVPAPADATPVTPGPEWDNFALLKILGTDETKWPGAPLLQGPDFDHYVAAYERSGFRGGINYYRNFSRNWELSAGFEQKTDVPSLMISAENDPFLTPAMADGMPKYVTDLERHTIPNCGHWTQMERPEALSGHMLDWLARRFPV